MRCRARHGSCAPQPKPFRLSAVRDPPGSVCVCGPHCAQCPQYLQAVVGVACFNAELIATHTHDGSGPRRQIASAGPGGRPSHGSPRSRGLTTACQHCARMDDVPQCMSHPLPCAASMSVCVRPCPSVSVGVVSVRRCPSVFVGVRRCPSVSSVSVGVHPCPSVSVGVRPCPSVSVRVRPCPSVSVRLRPSPSVSVRLRPSPSVSVRLGRRLCRKTNRKIEV